MDNEQRSMAEATSTAGVGAPRVTSPLADAARRLRRRPGRPRRARTQEGGGRAIQRAGADPASSAAPVGRFATALPPGQRGLKVHEVATYLNTSRRGVWRLVGRGLLRPVRWPGSRTVRFDLADVEALFGENYKA